MKVTALVTREGDWWAVQVPEVDGVFTQSASLAEVPDQVRDAVGLMLGIVGADVEVEVRPVESRAG